MTPAEAREAIEDIAGHLCGNGGTLRLSFSREGLHVSCTGCGYMGWKQQR